MTASEHRHNPKNALAIRVPSTHGDSVWINPGRRALYRRGTPENLGRINRRARGGDPRTKAGERGRENISAMAFTVEPALHRAGGEQFRLPAFAGGIESIMMFSPMAPKRE